LERGRKVEGKNKEKEKRKNYTFKNSIDKKRETKNEKRK
jgi:hypothetical protein